ncbi:serine/threonine kinase [Aureococcus anophagefferens]|nr:serine/threonine kinase [Aureococcus anophagefferens]
MMRRWLRLLLAAAAAAKRTVNMAGVVEVDAWMHHRAPPPRRWDATDPAALGAKWTKLSSGFYKEVHRATLGGDDVVVKRRKLYKADRNGRRRALSGEALYHEREVRGEVLYLDTRVTYAVDLAGSSLGDGDGDVGHRSRPSKAYAAWARRDPLACAAALLRCFESFAERGGFFLDDFAVKQFTVDERKGEIWLVDGPKALAGPIRDFFVRRGLPALPASTGPCSKKEPCPATPTSTRAPARNRRRDAASVRFTQVPRAAAAENANIPCGPSRRTASGAARPAARRAGRGLPNGTCAPVGAHTHAFDVGAKVWALPAIATFASKHAARRRRCRSRRRCAPEPGDRPTFAAAVAELEAARPRPPPG